MQHFGNICLPPTTQLWSKIVEVFPIVFSIINKIWFAKRFRNNKKYRKIRVTDSWVYLTGSSWQCDRELDLENKDDAMSFFVIYLCNSVNLIPLLIVQAKFSIRLQSKIFAYNCCALTLGHLFCWADDFSEVFSGISPSVWLWELLCFVLGRCIWKTLIKFLLTNKLCLA
jgi:hypothetical protein